METLPSALHLWTCGESMEEDGSSGSQGSGFTETGLQGRSDSLCLLPRGGQPDPAAEVGGGRGSLHLKEQRVLKKENSGLGA